MTKEERILDKMEENILNWLGYCGGIPGRHLIIFIDTLLDYLAVDDYDAPIPTDPFDPENHDRRKKYDAEYYVKKHALKDEIKKSPDCMMFLLHYFMCCRKASANTPKWVYDKNFRQQVKEFVSLYQKEEEQDAENNQKQT